MNNRQDPARRLRVCCFGDSNTYGFDPQDRLAGRYSPEDRWPELLARQTGWEVLNAGANGRQIPRSAYTLRLLARQGPVDLLIVMLGTNDLLQGAPVPEIGARMAAFLRPLLPRCPQVLLLSPPTLKRGAWVGDDGLVARSAALAPTYRGLARELGILFADAAAFQPELAYDGVHLTPAGNHTFARNLLHALQEMCLL